MSLSSCPPPSDDAVNETTRDARAIFDRGGKVTDAMAQLGITRASAKHYHLEWRQVRGWSSSEKNAAFKVAQVRRFVNPGASVVELFSGRHGRLTQAYLAMGCSLSIQTTSDSFQWAYKLVSETQVFDVVDIDPYGYPTRLFPHAFLLLRDGLLFVTMPKPGANHGSGITDHHLRAYFGTASPSLCDVLDRLWWWGLTHWREFSLLDVVETGRVWRIAGAVRRVSAVDFCQVRNRRSLSPMVPVQRDPPEWLIPNRSGLLFEPREAQK